MVFDGTHTLHFKMQINRSERTLFLFQLLLKPFILARSPYTNGITPVSDEMINAYGANTTGLVKRPLVD